MCDRVMVGRAAAAPCCGCAFADTHPAFFTTCTRRSWMNDSKRRYDSSGSTGLSLIVAIAVSHFWRDATVKSRCNSYVIVRLSIGSAVNILDVFLGVFGSRTRPLRLGAERQSVLVICTTCRKITTQLPKNV